MSARRMQHAMWSVATVAMIVSGIQPAPAEDSAFSASHKVVLDTMEEMRVLLESAKDAKSARDAAKLLPEMTDRFVTQSKAATALYLALAQDEKLDAQKALQEELIAKIKAGKLNPKNDLVSLMVDLSKGPQRSILDKPLTQLRDTLLEQRSIYVPVTARESIAKKLGAKGTPLAK